MTTLRQQRRLLNAAGVLCAIALMGYALYSQHVLGLDPCPLCILQRIALIGLGAVFLLAALHAPLGFGARAYGVLGALVALTGASVSAWHVHVQNLPPEAVPACGPGFDYIIDAFPWQEAFRLIFTGSGECHDVNWAFLGLSMPAWVFAWFVGLGVFIVAANWRAAER